MEGNVSAFYESRLCVRCLTAMPGSYTEAKRFGSTGELPKDHHRTLKELKDAADLGCSICCAVWEKLSNQCQHAALERAVSSRSDYEHQPWGANSVYATSIEFISLEQLVSVYIILHITELLNGGSPEIYCFRLVPYGDWYPTRLLDLGTTGSPQVIETSCTTPAGDYMTLSHRWSRQPSLLLSRHTKDKLYEKFDMTRLPLAIRDASMICIRLGVRYLWVDTLCIIQDEEDLADWKKESTLMDKVYEGSLLNLFALAASDTEDSLFRKRDPMDVTKGSDKLVALSGLAKRLSKVVKDEYVVGMWRRDLRNGILWYCSAKMDEKEYPGPRRSSEYRAPTFSWASMDAEICMALPVPYRHETYAKILDCQLDFVTGDVTGLCRGGHLVLQCRLQRLIFRHRRGTHGWESPYKADLITPTGTLREIKSPHLDELPSFFQPVARYDLYAILWAGWEWILPGSTRLLYHLLLQAVDKEPGTFRRIGIGKTFINTDSGGYHGTGGGSYPLSIL
ncbi:hypothetical protein PG987_006879 [Apiospora arundinis]